MQASAKRKAAREIKKIRLDKLYRELRKARKKKISNNFSTCWITAKSVKEDFN